MYDDILFPTDGSDPAESVLDYVLQVAAAHDATLHVLSVVDTGHESRSKGGARDSDRTTEAERLVDDISARARDGGVAATSVVRQGAPSAEIVAYSDASAIDLIVMPTKGRRGLERVLLGSVTERVIEASTVPTITVNPDRDRPLVYPPTDVLVPTDGSQNAMGAVKEGVAVANATGATLHLLYVVETTSLGPDARSAIREETLAEEGREVLSTALDDVDTDGIDDLVREISFGRPAAEILDYVDSNDVDLAILGTHGRTDFKQYVLGGVSAKLVRTASIPVMWVRDAS
jgi:nucleotide-binding universal stress UspA family protein